MASNGLGKFHYLRNARETLCGRYLSLNVRITHDPQRVNCTHCKSKPQLASVTQEQEQK